MAVINRRIVSETRDSRGVLRSFLFGRLWKRVLYRLFILSLSLSLVGRSRKEWNGKERVCVCFRTLASPRWRRDLRNIGRYKKKTRPLAAFRFSSLVAGPWPMRKRPFLETSSRYGSQLDLVDRATRLYRNSRRNVGDEQSGWKNEDEGREGGKNEKWRRWPGSLRPSAGAGGGARRSSNGVKALADSVPFFSLKKI